MRELATGEESQGSPLVFHSWEKLPRLCCSSHEGWFYPGKPVLVAVLQTLLSRTTADVHKKQMEKENETIKLNFGFSFK